MNNTDWEKLCGLDYQKIESQNEQLQDHFYPGLNPEALYTSFIDYDTLFNALPCTVQHVCDLGAGVGKLAPIWKSLRPQGQVTLIEYVPSRARAAQEMVSRLALENVTVKQEDILENPIPSADAYFIYLPVNKILEKILSDLRNLKKEFYLIAIESHGSLFDRLDDFTNLKLIQKIELDSARHSRFGHIYYYSPSESKFSLWDEVLGTSRFKKVLRISDVKGEWLGLSEDLVWMSASEILLKSPPRTILKKDILSVHELSEFPDRFQHYLKLMQDEIFFEGSLIRKIWVSPEIYLEMQSGAKISLPSSSE